MAARIQDADKMLSHGYLVILDYLVLITFFHDLSNGFNGNGP